MPDARISPQVSFEIFFQEALPGGRPVVGPQFSRTFVMPRPGTRRIRRKAGTTYPMTSARHTTVWESPTPRRSIWLASKALIRVGSGVRQPARRSGQARVAIFTDTDSALARLSRSVPRIFRNGYLHRTTTSLPLSTRQSGRGSFIYIPKGVKIDFPLQAYFRINSENMGQFERTLIIVDEGGWCHYVEGCTCSDIQFLESLHSAVVEIIVKLQRPFAATRRSELVEQRVQPRYQAGDGLRRLAHGMGGWQPLGSKLTMKYPAIYLMEPGAAAAKRCRSPLPVKASI